MLDQINKVSWPGWETVRLVGRGSFGAVYEIQRDLMGDPEKAALKVISIPQHDSDIEELYSDGYTEESVTMTFQSHLKSILDEYAMMKKLNECINIVNCDDVHYVKHSDGIGWDIFIKMELLTPLHKSLPDNVPEELVVKIARDMCSALEMCRRYGVIHRDIKPQNIFVSPNGNYKLGDFGIAKTVEKTTGGTKIGTYKYMAPEVYLSKPYGASADIYSLGLVLYWLLNERRMPFVPLPPADINMDVADEARNRRFAGEQIPEPAHGSRALKRIVLKACAFEPKDRYSTAAELLKDLAQLDGGVVVDPYNNYRNGEDEDRTIGMFGGTQYGEHTDRTGATTRTANAVVNDSLQTENDIPPANQETKNSSEANNDKKKKGKKLPIIIGAALAAVVVLIFLLIRGCGATTETPPTTNMPEEGITETAELVLPKEPFELYIGEIVTLQFDGGGSQISFESSDKKVVTVNKKGEVTAVGAGTATIMVKSGDSVKTVDVIVKDYEMSLSTDNLLLFVDATATLETNGIPEDAVVEWNSDNKKIAVVENGEVTAVGEGTATITATWKNGQRTYTANAVVTVETEGITLSTYQINSFYIGDTKTIKATTAIEGQTVTWTSSDTKIATVKDGKVTAVGAGSAEITAVAGSKSATCTVTVLKPSVNLSKSSATAYIGDSVILTATADPSDASINWSSDNAGVATVSGGKVTALDAGKTTIRAKITHAGESYEATCKITVQKPDVKINKSSATLLIGDSATLSASTEPSGISVKWSSNDSNIVTVNDGKITAVGAGTAKVSATISYAGNSYKATCKVTVTEPSVTLNKTSVSLVPGESAKLSATTVPENSKVSWSSSDEGIATVSGGTVKAVAVGSAKITAKISYGGQTYKATCKVTVEKPSISVTSSSSTIEFSERDKGTATLTATVRPDDGEINWSISDTSIASISGKGTTAKVTAKAVGSVTVTATYTANGTTVKDTCDLTISKAPSTLKVTGISYPSKSTIDAFYFDAKISSNYQITKLEITGKAVSNATGLSASDSGTYVFVSNVYESTSADAATITQFLKDRYRTLYKAYTLLAGILGADDSLTITVYSTVYDSSGNSYSFTINYILDE